MASVKERAAALNLAGKLYSPMHRPGDHRMVGKPFQSSIIWSNIIAHLQAEVKVKRRRHYLKSHSNCFLGADAVNVIETYINRNKILGDINVPRAKVVRACQALLDCKVFEAVACKAFGKESKLSVFQDSDSSLYRFLGAKNPPLSNAENSLPSSTEQSQTHSQLYRQDDPVFFHSTPVKADHIMDLLLEEPDLSPSFLQTETLPQSVVSQVWQEQTVQRLLQLIELPLLDGVLDCRECNTPLSGADNNTPDLLYTSNYLDREILKAFKDSQKDEWLSAALDLLDFLPDQLVVEVSRELPSFSLENEGDEGHGPSTSIGIEQCKALLFDILAKHYGQANVQPLLTSALNDVYTQITELLVNGKFEVALEVLQLSLKLLPVDSREELYRLLRFMSLAAEPEHVRLHKETENRMMVKKTFSRAVIQSKCLPKGKVDLLLLFMLDNYQEIFKIPGSLHKLVSDKLDDLLKKKNPNTHSYAFCQQISSNLYENTVKELTRNELFVLLRNIDENAKYSTKEKNRLLAQFYKGHPDVFAQYFGSRLSTINLFEV